MNRAVAVVGFVAAVVIGSTMSASGQARTAKPPKYDTPAQTQAKIDALFEWTLENSSASSPAASRREYAIQVLEILTRIRAPRITIEMYEQLDTHAYGDDTGDFIAHAWLVFGQVPDELSRSSIGDAEIVVYQWKNSDGGNVIGTFRNAQLVSKAQSGLPRAGSDGWNPKVSESALVRIRAKRGIKVREPQPKG